jgi:hypothetical protein
VRVFGWANLSWVMRVNGGMRVKVEIQMRDLLERL